MTEIFLYNTLGRKLETFTPRHAERVTIYSCGPTVYSRQHLGNLRSYVFADLLKRVLLLGGHRVEHVINITDVGHLTDDADQGEDKMERAAERAGIPALEIARVWTELFQRDLALLDVLPPNVWAKATDHIPEQLELIRTLERRGFTYVAPDGIYFDTARDPGYGALSRLAPSISHARIEGATGKRTPADFALWKFSPRQGPRRQLEWESPWGRGFPGWHIECSAMALRYLGSEIDIHTGGIDHVAVHHTNEIAQSEAALGAPGWVRFWMHGGWLTLDGEKISKSRSLQGKVPDLDDLSELGVSPAGFRYYLYTAHYRQPLTLSSEALRGAESARRRLRALVHAGRGETLAGPHRPPVHHQPLETLREQFLTALFNDLNAPEALAVLWEIANLRTLPVAARGALVGELASAIGIDLLSEELGPAPHDDQVEALVARREQARRERDFALSDALRAELTAKGVVVEEDTPTGPKWHWL